MKRILTYATLLASIARLKPATRKMPRCLKSVTRTNNPISVSADGAMIFVIDADNFIRSIRLDGSDYFIPRFDAFYLCLTRPRSE